MMQECLFFPPIKHHHILPNNTITVSGVSIPLYTIGDSTYPLKLWLMKLFAHNTDLTSNQRNYNYSAQGTDHCWNSIWSTQGKMAPLDEEE